MHRVLHHGVSFFLVSAYLTFRKAFTSILEIFCWRFLLGAAGAKSHKPVIPWPVSVFPILVLVL